MSTTQEVKKKKNVCKRHRKNWRKYIDTKDVDDFLDNQRQQERIGSGKLKSKQDAELFVIDEHSTKESRQQRNLPLTKKERARLPMACYKNLEPLTAVPDPITKRNRVKVKEERESVILKKIREKKLLAQQTSQSAIRAIKDRKLTLKKKKAQPRQIVFKNDVWIDDDKKPDTDWLGKDALEHYLTETGGLKIRVPKGILRGKSVLPAIEVPHPGTSYNPSLPDHQALLEQVASKELDLQKQEAHLNRVTSACFLKVTAEDKQREWLTEMSQGLVKSEDVAAEGDVEVKEEKLSDEEDTKENIRLSIGKPTNRLKAKTRKQRRIQRVLRDEALKRKATKTEKKKISDIYELRKLKTQIENVSKKQKLMAERRKKLEDINIGRTKRLGRKAFEEPDIDFSRPSELRSRLNLIKKQGSILADRYTSLQKRNLLAPGTKQLGPKKAKVKKFVKLSHKTEGAPTVGGKPKRRSKQNKNKAMK